ncbi:MAG: hypothetical protein M1365_11295, partial [Actinobacteria bacterium]|nr:hypothetical protein [Actinomycetota bacterium]
MNFYFKKIFKKPVFISVLVIIVFLFSLILPACGDKSPVDKDKESQSAEQAGKVDGSNQGSTESTVVEITTQPPENYYVSSSNEFADYSFICPDEWQLFESEEGGSVILHNNKSSGSESESIFIFVKSISGSDGLSDKNTIMTSYTGTAADDSSVQIFEEEEITVDGQNTGIAGYSYVSSLEKEQSQKSENIDYFTLLKDDKSLYCIKYIGLNKDAQAAKNTFKDFLETFSIKNDQEKVKEKDENSQVNLLILGDDSGMGRPGGRVNGNLVLTDN